MSCKEIVRCGQKFTAWLCVSVAIVQGGCWELSLFLHPVFSSRFQGGLWRIRQPFLEVLISPVWYSWITQFCSVTQSCLTLCDPMDCRTPGFPVLSCVPEFAQTHVHWVSDAIQPSHPLSSPSLPAFNLSQHQGHFKWVSSSHQVAKVLELQLQHQFFLWTFRTDFL